MPVMALLVIKCMIMRREKLQTSNCGSTKIKIDLKLGIASSQRYFFCPKIRKQQGLNNKLNSYTYIGE